MFKYILFLCSVSEIMVSMFSGVSRWLCNPSEIRIIVIF